MRAWFRSPFYLFSVTVVLTLAFVSCLTGAPAWDPTELAPYGTIPFSADPQDLIRHFDTLPVDDPIFVRGGLYEFTISFDSEGRETRTNRMIYQIMSANALEGWSSTTVDWAPWFQNRPLIQIRIVNPDGSTIRLDDDEAIEHAAREMDPLLYSDRRVLRLPYRGVQIGSIVEEVVTVSNHSPFFSAGISGRVYLQHMAPFDLVHTVVEHPLSKLVEIQLFGVEAESYSTSSSSATMRHKVELRNVPGFEPPEYGLPYDVTAFAHIAYSTAANWKAVAAAYSEMVDQALDGMDFTNTAALLAGATVEEKMTETIAFVQSSVRYTGLLLGDNSIRPADASEILDRGFGDCKDMAVVTVGLLRAQGMDAHVTLLSSGTAEDTPETLPGLGIMDHAIVYVDHGDGFWLDPTARFAEPLTVRIGNQGRRALIARPNQDSLVLIPESPTSASWATIERTIELPDDEWADMRTEAYYSGPAAEIRRHWYSMVSDQEVRESLEHMVEEFYNFGDITSIDRSDPYDNDRPFRFSWAVHEFGRAGTYDTEALAAIMPQIFVESLPHIFLDETLPARQDPYYESNPFVSTWTYRIIAPQSYVIRSIPRPIDIQMGTMRLRGDFHEEGSSVVVGTITLDTGARLMSAEQVEHARFAIAGIQQMDGLTIYFDHEGARLIGEGRYAEGLAIYRRAVEERPDSPARRRRLADALLRAGLRRAARQVLEQALELTPDDPSLHAAMGSVLIHDSLGRAYYPGFEREAAIESYRKSLELDPSEGWVWYELASALEVNELGAYRGTGADVAGALDAYCHMVEELGDLSVLYEAIESALVIRDFREAHRLTSLLMDTQQAAYFRFMLGVLENPPEDIERRVRGLGNDYAREAILGDANALLMAMREYERVAAILRIASRGTPYVMSVESTAAFIESLGKAPRHDKRPPVERLGVDFLKGALLYTADDGELLRSTISDDLAREMDNEAMDGLLGAGGVLENMYSTTGVDRKMLEDILLSSVQVSASGSASIGYDITIRIDVMGVYEEMHLLAAMFDGIPLIVGSTDSPGPLGRHILTLIGEGKLAAARWWLGRIEDLGGPASQLLKLLLDRSPSDQELGLIAAVLAVADGDPEQLSALATMLEELRDVVPAADLDRYRRATIMLAEGYESAGDNDSALQVIEDVYRDDPADMRVLEQYLRLLRNTGRFGDLRTVIDDLDYPGRQGVLRLRAQRDLAMGTGDLHGAERALQSLVIRDREEGFSYYNTLAWLQLFKPDNWDRALEYVSQSLELGGSTSPAVLHTAATILARMNRPEDALAMLQSSLDTALSHELRAFDWLVIGYIALDYELEDVARDAFEMVQADDGSPHAHFTSYELAKEELSKL